MGLQAIHAIAIMAAATQPPDSRRFANFAGHFHSEGRIRIGTKAPGTWAKRVAKRRKKKGYA